MQESGKRLKDALGTGRGYSRFLRALLSKGPTDDLIKLQVLIAAVFAADTDTGRLIAIRNAEAWILNHPLASAMAP